MALRKSQEAKDAKPKAVTGVPCMHRLTQNQRFNVFSNVCFFWLLTIEFFPE